MDIKEVIEYFQTSSTHGLDEKEARKRLIEYGYNEILVEKRRGVLSIFLEQFKSILVLILLASVVISVFVGEMEDAIVIMVIVILNAVLGFIQEYRAEKALEALKKLASPKAIVIRNGREITIPSREVVPGDIIILEVGNKVPADARLIEAVNLRVDESILTGESVPVSKFTEPLEDPHTPIHERRNMVYMATTVVYGRGKAVVTATGMNTEFGKIASMLQEEEEETPLQRKLEKFGRILAIVIVFLSALAGLECLLEGASIIDMLLTAISLAVSAVPEGLPAVVTVTLAIGVQRMARKNAIVRRLSSVETLGSSTVICTDKTGTLTKNEMTVREIYVWDRRVHVTGTGYEPKGKFYLKNRVINPKEDVTLMKLILAGALCNDARLEFYDKEWRIIGDPTEGALVVLAEKAGLSKEKLEKEYVRIDEIPFDSIRKRMSTIHRRADGEIMLFIKGAPEVIVERAKYIEKAGKVYEISKEEKEKILLTARSMAKKALRVLAIGYRPLSIEYKSEGDLERNIILLGLVGMIDPPRPEVKEAIKVAEEAGITVIMVTGDHKETAVAIAKEIGLIKDESDTVVLTGKDIDSLSDEEFLKLVDEVRIYARVSPEHKLRIIDALKRKGHIVAMTGDGVNDAPSVKKADIGIAMGIRGSDVTREAADLILADDNFATIVSAIKEGRTIYENIRKFLRLLLSVNWDEIFVVFFAALLDLPLPFTPKQILWINLVTDGLPALALGMDPPDEGIMKKKPRDPGEEIYHGMIVFIIASVILALISWLTPFYIALQMKETLDEARTLAFTQAILFELILAFICRSEETYIFSSWKNVTANKMLVVSVITALILHLSIIYVPLLNYFFDTAPLTLTDWLLLVPFACLSLILYPKPYLRLENKLEKRIRRK